MPDNVVGFLAQGPTVADPDERAVLLPSGLELANIGGEIWAQYQRCFRNIMHHGEVLTEWWPYLTQTKFKIGRSEALSALKANRMHNIEAIGAIANRSHMVVRRWINDPKFPEPYYMGKTKSKRVWSGLDVAQYLVDNQIIKDPTLAPEE